MAKPPTMQRSRAQLAGAYAPHCLFTFEGGAGACMALAADGNRPADLNQITRLTIGEQIQEYFVAWAARAARGNNLRHPVPLELAVDSRVISENAVRVRTGELEFQVPETVGYVPYPLAFVCNSCDLHRESRRPDRLESDAENFRNACPRGSANCVDDWQQIDVVLAHWSGDVDAISPRYRTWSSQHSTINEFSSCSSCETDRFFLRRPPGSLSGWHFECVQCHTVRPLIQRDRASLTSLGALLDQGQALVAEINMEPISYRASAAYYSHGDRLLVFDRDEFMKLLGTPLQSQLETFLTSEFGYPATAFSDTEKESLLRAAGRIDEWNEYIGTKKLLEIMTANSAIPAEAMEPAKSLLARRDGDWNSTVFAGSQSAAPGVVAACRSRSSYVRKFDPVRMAVEHKTLVEEKLHGGLTSDQKQVSVDVAILDPFLVPDGLSATQMAEMLKQVRNRLEILGIEEMRLVRDVRVCEYSFGYTRTSSSPTVMRDKAGQAEMPVRLRLFDRVRVGDASRHPVLCLTQSNEGFYIRLRERTVLAWLQENLVPIPPADPGVRLGGRLIEEFAQLENNPDLRFSRFLDEYRREQAVPRQAYPFVYTLLHTLSHHVIGVCSAMSGLDLGSFGEHIFAPDLSILVYRRGLTMDLGNLSSMWRDRGDVSYGNEILEKMISPVSLRCGSESVCNHRGGACPDCVLIPETTCLTRNELLSRSILVGRGVPRWDAVGDRITGFYEVAARHAREPKAE
jgi:hypothetical protein